MRNVWTVALGSLWLMLGCHGAQHSDDRCGDGDAVNVGDANYCVYAHQAAIVIVGGFDCPTDRPYRADYQRATVCSDRNFDGVDVPGDICTRVFIPCLEPEPEVDAGHTQDPDAGTSQPDASNLPMLASCPGSEFYTTFSDCMAAGKTAGKECYLLPDNTTCGLCQQAFDCSVHGCPSYTERPSAATECETIPVYEGECGNVRYRHQSGGYGGPTYYWDATTGALLAIWNTTDHQAFCDNTSFSMIEGDPSVVANCEIVLDETTAQCPDTGDI